MFVIMHIIDVHNCDCSNARYPAQEELMRQIYTRVHVDGCVHHVLEFVFEGGFDTSAKPAAAKRSHADTKCTIMPSNGQQNYFRSAEEHNAPVTSQLNVQVCKNSGFQVILTRTFR